MQQYKNPYLMLKNMLPSMHRVEKKIASFILDEKNKVESMTLKEIAKNLDIAESSIVRFSKTLGYTGFSNFKLNLARHSNKVSSPVFDDIRLTDSIPSVVNKVFNGSIDTLQNTLKMLDFNAIDTAVNAINSAKKIVFFGIGSSSTIANDFYYRFMRIGLDAYAHIDSHIGYVASSLLNEDSVAIAISHKGRTRQIIENMKMAKEKDATTICVTSFLNSPLTNHCDISLCISTNETEVLSEAIASRIAHITILDCLYACLVIKRQDTALPLIDNMNNVLDQARV